MNNETEKHPWQKVLDNPWLLLALGALTRIAGNDYGLPQSYHPDEGFIVNRAIG